MKVIFLDIDGVLNSADYMLHRRNIPRPTPHSIDAPTVPRLNAITDRTGAKIVVSSTWRLGGRTQNVDPVARMRRILGAHGVTGEIIDVTPYLASVSLGGIIVKRERGHEIQAWLDNHYARSFAILDDGSDMAHLRGHLVQTSWEFGLLDEHVERVVEMLGEIRR